MEIIILLWKCNKESVKHYLMFLLPERLLSFGAFLNQLALCKVVICYWVAIGNPVRKIIPFFFFSVLGKVFPDTPLLSSIFVGRVTCAYFWWVSGGSVVHSRIFNLPARRRESS